MITVHVSPSANKVYIEHTPYGNLMLSPEDAWSIYQRLKERQTDIYNLVVQEQERLSTIKPANNEEPQ